MKYSILVGLQVDNDSHYSEYRRLMKPLLAQHGGGFSYDFTIDKTLTSATEGPINRVFVIYFENKQEMEKFFALTEYKSIKERYFTTSVSSTTIMGELMPSNA